MAEQSIQSITIDAPAAEVMAVIADFAHYPEWAGAIKDVEVTDPGDGDRARQVRFRIDAAVVKDVYELAYTWSGDDKVEWELVSGEMQKAQHGSYTLVPTGSATEVTYALSVDLNIPMLGLLKRKGERVIMDTALKELKKRVESGSR